MSKVFPSKCLWLLSAFLFCQGCATSGFGYWANRGRDAADIFTLTIGKGGGASAKVGPVHAGLFFGFDRIGLRGGEFKTRWEDDSAFAWAALVDPLIVLPPIGPREQIWGCGSFEGQIENKRCLAELRGKAFSAFGVCPFVMKPRSEEYRWKKYPYYYWSEIEVSVGLGITLRAGFNPGELLDFLLGFVGIDIFDDDLTSSSFPHP